MKLKSCDGASNIRFDKKCQELPSLESSPQVDLLTYKSVKSTAESKETYKSSSSSQLVRELTVTNYSENGRNISSGLLPSKVDQIELRNREDSSKMTLKQEPQIQTRPYPKPVFFIIGNEFCERFSFYGLRTVLVLYLRNVLDFDDSKSTILFHLFAVLCYIMPIFGAVLADSKWGKFKTIWYLSIVYFSGEVILIISSIFWDRGQLSTILTFFGLIMIGLGTGGIKPCVAPFGGDQFLPHEERWRQSFFSMFYGTINVACLLGMFLAPMLKSVFQCVRRSDCYPVAFSLPSGLMLLAIAAFLAAKNRYIHNPLPEQNIIVAFCKCIRVAIKRKLAGESVVALDDCLAENGQIKEKTCDKSGDKKKCWLHLAADQFSDENIQNFRRVLHAFLILIPIPMFYCLHDQQGSLWTLQANRMDGRIFNTGFSFEPDQIIVANPIVVLLAIPILDLFIYPSLSKRGLLVKPVKRMTFGGLLTALAFVSSALIEFHMQRSLPITEPLPGQSNLLLINGLNKCSIVSPIISDDDEISIIDNNESLLDQIKPLSSYSIYLDASNSTSSNNFRLKFKLHSNCREHFPHLVQELDIKSISIETTKLLYLHANDNGKITYYLFNESLQLPEAGKARVQLLYVGSELVTNSIDRFSFIRASEITNDGNMEVNRTRFIESETRGRLSISKYKEVGLPTKGDKFVVYFDEKSVTWLNDNSISLKTGTRNLVIVQHDVDKQTVKIHHELLQDNDYYVSMLYQLIPYVLISVAEVMIAVTGISYLDSIAPKTMKAVVFGAWYSTLAIGNLFTVVLESLITFSNITNKFLFYAALMALDSVLLSYIGTGF